jgi:phage virion morphogenesis protein
MTVSINVKIDDQQVRQMLERLQQRMGDLSPVMRVIGEIVRTSVVKNFESGGRPRWPVSKRAAQQGGQTLIKSSRLMKSITWKASRDSVAIGTNVLYAAIHQLGGKTGPHEIRPKNKKALRTPFGIFRKVKHPGSKIPARPFLMVQDEDWRQIAATISDYLTK